MKVLLTGAAGQLGCSLIRTVSKEHELITRDLELDITNPDAVSDAMRTLTPGLVVNAAAYTAVDKAESEPDKAYAVNAHGPEVLAKACHKQGIRLIHISTDFVFDGEKSHPYTTTDQRSPLGVYGASKSAGEDRVIAALGEAATIIRTGWLYASEGHNFVNTVLHLINQKSELPVIADQIGTPTWAMSLAQLIWLMVERTNLHGIFHWSDAGVASWYDFAVAIQEEALVLGILTAAIPIKPIPTEAYPLAARRPAYSVLDKQKTIKSTGFLPSHWRVNLREMLKEMSHA
jgi:dTDP-4-dehydrorhamnose reductase